MVPLVDDFYTDLAIAPSWSAALATGAGMVAVPAAWYVVITDVVGSTQAIEAGHYRQVNLLGAASIIALLNLNPDRPLPFVFGGDGALVLLPPSLVMAARLVLRSTQAMAQQRFQLTLRAGIVPMADLYGVGQGIEIAKVRVSGRHDQALLRGSGLDTAESWVKDPQIAPRYDVMAVVDQGQAADFGGLMCPWQEIIGRDGDRDEFLALLIKVIEPGAIARREEGQIYQKILQQITDGADQPPNPLQPQQLQPALTIGHFQPLGKIQGWRRGFWSYGRAIGRSLGQNLRGWWNTHIRKCDRERPAVVGDTDYLKFDNTLRLVIASDRDRTAAIQQVLEQAYQRGQIIYGLHRSRAATMTCIMSQRGQKHVGLLDGADGGYALAAKHFKRRWRSYQQTTKSQNP